MFPWNKKKPQNTFNYDEFQRVVEWFRGQARNEKEYIECVYNSIKHWPEIDRLESGSEAIASHIVLNDGFRVVIPHFEIPTHVQIFDKDFVDAFRFSASVITDGRNSASDSDGWEVDNEADDIFGVVPRQPLAKEVMKGLETATPESKLSKVEKLLKARKQYLDTYDYDAVNLKLHMLGSCTMNTLGTCTCGFVSCASPMWNWSQVRDDVNKMAGEL